MKENVLERNARMDTDRKIADFRVKQQMNHVMQDDRGNWYGWGRVLDYIGVEWRDPEVALINAAEQITMDDAIRYLADKAAE